jgi:WXG100 family type VII secretion target
MPARVIQCDYDDMAAIRETFSQQADQTRQLMDVMRRLVGDLQSGGWIGTGAQAFFAEMEDLVLPGMDRMSEALADAGSATQRISEVLRTAEEEAARLFQGDDGLGAAGGAAGGAGGASGGTGGPNGAAGQGAPGSSPPRTYPQPSWPVNLNDPRQIDAIIRPNVRGADSTELAEVMRRLNNNPTGAALDGALSELAQIRGVPEAQIRSDYERFLQLRQQALDSPYGREHGIEPLADGTSFGDSFRAGDSFWGTTDQLRFGQIVGDTFGIDPVFGSMLSPTGGLVGPGDSVLHMGLGDQKAVVIHGSVHDAGGFLRNHFGIGPGYHYVPGTWQILDTTNPLAGQVDGIQFWMNELDRRGID